MNLSKLLADLTLRPLKPNSDTMFVTLDLVDFVNKIQVDKLVVAIGVGLRRAFGLRSNEVDFVYKLVNLSLRTNIYEL